MKHFNNNIVSIRNKLKLPVIPIIMKKRTLSSGGYMFKRLLLTCTLLTPLVTAAYTNTYYPKGITLAHVQQASQIKIFWDIHGVLAQKDGGARIGAVLGNIFSLASSKLGDNKSWNEINKIKKEADVSGEAYMQVLLKNGDPDAAHAAEAVANAYKPRKGMQAVVQKLNAAGHEQYIASNIGPRCYQNLKKKFSKKSEGRFIFDIIKMGKCVDYSKYGNGGMVSDFNPIHLSATAKPHGRFFSDIQRDFNPHNKSLMIMIDDRIENIHSAVAHGFVGIHLDTGRDHVMKEFTQELERLQLFKLRK